MMGQPISRRAVMLVVALLAGVLVLTLGPSAWGRGLVRVEQARSAGVPCPRPPFVRDRWKWRKTIRAMDDRYGCGAAFVRCAPGHVDVAVWGTYFRGYSGAEHVQVKAYLEYKHAVGEKWLGATKSGYRWNAGRTEEVGKGLFSDFFPHQLYKAFWGENSWNTGVSGNLNDAIVRVHVVMKWRLELDNQPDSTVQTFDEYAGYCRTKPGTDSGAISYG